MGAGREFAGNVALEGGESGGVPLSQGQVGNGGAEGAGIVKLGERGLAFEAHGAGVIKQQLDAQVGLVFKLFDVKAVGFGEGPPVDVADVVPGAVEFVLAELD